METFFPSSDPINGPEKSPRKLHLLPILSNLQDFLAATIDERARHCSLLGLDVSKRAIGIAGSDADWRLATPVITIKRTGLKNDIEKLQSLILERQAAALVIGFPLNMDGSEGPRCQAIRQFAGDVDKVVNQPILLWDERLTTFAAEEHAREIGLKGRKKDERLDALAAAAILEDALDSLQQHLKG
ncbi:MAG: Holliday junction resolvase RuvX [Geminicoccaceae bacterium]